MAILLLLTLLLVVILTIDDVHLHLLNNAPAITNLLTVTTLEDSGAGSLRQEIAAAQNGATITFASLQGTVKLTQGLEMPVNVSIEAPMAHQITIIPQKPTTTLHIPQGKNVSFVNIDFQGNNEARANAFIVNEGTLHISHSRISSFQSRSDGALHNLNGTLTFTQSEIDHNQTLEIGGGSLSNSKWYIDP